MTQDAILSKIILSDAPSDLSCIEESDFNKDIKTEQSWTFELSIESENIVPIIAIIGFQEISRLSHQNKNEDVFYRPTVSRAQ